MFYIFPDPPTSPRAANMGRKTNIRYEDHFEFPANTEGAYRARCFHCGVLVAAFALTKSNLLTHLRVGLWHPHHHDEADYQFFHQLGLSFEHHSWFSIDAPPHSETCFCFELILTTGARCD